MENKQSLPAVQAMIFSAGLGTRFKPWTDVHPKALALVNGKSLLQRNVEYLCQYGIDDIVVNVHHFPDQIIHAIESNNGWGAKVRISDERDEVLETGGGLWKARDLFDLSKPILTINVDILTDLSLDSFLNSHIENQPLISLAVSERQTSRCFVFNGQDRLIGWRNQQTGEERMRMHATDSVNRAFSGISIFSPEFFKVVTQRGKFSLVDAFLALAPDHSILGYDHTGDKWVDVGKPVSVEVAEKLFG